MKRKHLKLLYLGTLVGVLVFAMVTTTYLIQTKNCRHFVFENTVSKLTRVTTQVTACSMQLVAIHIGCIVLCSSSFVCS